MILKGVFDVFLLAETKIDGAFPSSQFCIKEYKMFCKDRNRFGGSLIVYIRRGLITRRINHLEGNYIESIVLLVQPGRSSKWTLFLYTYELPNVTKNLWEPEFNSMLFNGSQRYDNLAILRDLNCDISHPIKGFREGRTLRESMNEYNSTNLIREPTRVTATSWYLIDVILTNRPRSFLTFSIFDLGLSDYHLVCAVSRSHYPRSCPITVERRFLRITIPSDFAKTCIRLHLTSH